MAYGRSHAAGKQDFLCSCYKPLAISCQPLFPAISHQLFSCYTLYALIFESGGDRKVVLHDDARLLWGLAPQAHACRIAPALWDRLQ